MNVGELISKLQELDPSAEIFIWDFDEETSEDYLVQPSITQATLLEDEKKRFGVDDTTQTFCL